MAQGGSPIKDPKDWKTGDDPATAAELSHLETLASQAGTTVSTEGMSKADVALKIQELRAQLNLDTNTASEGTDR